MGLVEWTHGRQPREQSHIAGCERSFAPCVRWRYFSNTIATSADTNELKLLKLWPVYTSHFNLEAPWLCLRSLINAKLCPRAHAWLYCHHRFTAAAPAAHIYILKDFSHGKANSHCSSGQHRAMVM